MTQASGAHNRNINEIGGDDDVFQFISKYKGPLTILIGLIVVGVLGWGYYTTASSSASKEGAHKVFTFTSGALKEFSESKLPVDQVVASFTALSKDVGNFQGIFSVGIQLADSLMLQGKNAEALTVLENITPVAKNEYSKYFLLARKAVVFEDLGKFDEAIKALEEINGLPLKMFEGKTYLDLGRIHLKKGNKDLAKKSFEYVVNTAKDEAEFVKIAKLYLGQM